MNPHIDHTESVAEELIINGYDVSTEVIRHTATIVYDSPVVVIRYTCGEKTIMGDYYRFISHYGLKLHSSGLHKKIEEAHNAAK